MLEQEIEKYLSGQTLCNCDSVSYRNIKNLILGFAEPREKRIAELEKRCNELFFQVNEKTERIAELEKENAELKKQLETVKEECCGKVFCPYRSEISLSEVENDSKSRM